MYTPKNSVKEVVKSMGLVFGDIGTSPLYTFTALFSYNFLIPTVNNVLGIVSLIIWTLTILVTIKYSWLVMSLSKKAEGGTIVLKEILSPLLKSKKKVFFFTILTFIGISLLIGDGVLTPAVSILSAVEGLKFIPTFEQLTTQTLVIIACIIAILLFLFQKRGTDKVAITFGPLMLIWFISLSIFGLVYIIQFPMILKALNPYYGIKFLIDHKFLGFFMLSSVILCVTGVEALYADMGHLGRKPIMNAWYFVFVALTLNYLGQGVFVLQHPEIKEVLFGMVSNYMPLYFYIPFLILSLIASVIASQAMISGVFSIIYQGITTRIMPIFKIDYTSTRLRSQIYISVINWFLLLCVLIIIFIFKKSVSLTAAYGLAVAGTMTITGIMTTSVFFIRKNYFKAAVAATIILVDIAFLFSTFFKIPHKGYISLVIASFPLILILIYTSGKRKIYKSLSPMSLDIFVDSFEEIYNKVCKIRGTALFFTREIQKIPPYIIKAILMDNIIYEENILVSITVLDVPFGISGNFEKNICSGLKAFKIKAGYMEVVKVEEILKKSGIDEKVIFYGIEDVITKNPIWKIFSFIRKNTSSYVQLYKLPVEKLHGVTTRIEM
ncbi:MAG: KUP/HAK/KT family potassium transporter [Candidatus Babeliales bacterium]